MRIIRGILKTKKITVPKNFPSRPTTDFAKEGLFNMLENRFDFIDLKLLDLCAGTGNISFEWLSREAGKAVAVDSNFNVVRHIRSLTKSFEMESFIQIVQSDVVKYLEKTTEKFDLIFADPPYEAKFHADIVRLVYERDLLNENGLLIIEHGKRTDLSELPHFELSRGYGNVIFSLFSKE
ncbi:16S rRNA (guanine(966)-N(2))-methyltransferase RsmD [Crocinitomicaceae bacterium CZZ-1]|uniref:16S rRNA (Guanine(966)-N(2))-methyltransferase RsmD n=1 Tax=Taishania pollutisoli TaxID=2766479 RepID=A0A8J6PJ88_9FLAO|nr:16S rRNA (guanine(966)-N(2))-methyltransferase RsmD [Taishania pollutisoli]MBX2949201.1 16S rRNA (guanine(966)-N(2))-methyltransferase RsmD [Crocinitomicaceae bacterium]NGF75867.1 16S rRNA (guanine(966)-N(2))-methyltransferase RsmD [Fluviicola sp. SGL-29]